MLFNTIFIFYGIVSSYSDDNNAPIWEEVKNHDGIQVYLKSERNSTIKRVKVTTTIAADIDHARDLLLDVPNYVNWQYACREAMIIQQLNSNEDLSYFVTRAPWPFFDRDMVFHRRIQSEDNPRIVKLHFTIKSRVIPEKEGLVRISKADGSWTLTQKANNHLKITHLLHLEPKGNVPDVVVNFALIDGSFETLYQFRKLLLTQ